MNIDVEIYMNNLIKFFKQNPKDLLNLVSEDKENDFYRLIKEAANINYEKGIDVALTQKQLLDICYNLQKTPSIPKYEMFLETKFGPICMN